MESEQRKSADKLLQLALELEEAGKQDKAIEVYKKCIATDPNWAVPAFNLGLIYKYRFDWLNSLEFNDLASKLDPSDEPAWWNLGIAATALGDWSTARRAWKGFGIKLPPATSGEEVRLNLGITPVRILTNSEVVWTTRIDPARAIIDSIPTSYANRRYRDLVLHDGAPQGYRTVSGKKVPVFDELQLLESSDYRTFSLRVWARNPHDLKLLEKLCDQADYAMENWTLNIRHLCEQCSRGVPHSEHDKNLPVNLRTGEFQLAIAGLEEGVVRRILLNWQSSTGCRVEEFFKIL